MMNTKYCRITMTFSANQQVWTEQEYH